MGMRPRIRRFLGSNLLAAAPAFSPADIAGLQLWLDANDSATLFQDAGKTTPAGDNDVVGAWADKSGQGNDATQATTSKKPTVSPAAINGLNTILGDADDEMHFAGITITNETIFAVVERTVNNTTAGIIGVSNTYRTIFTATANSIIYTYNSNGITKTGGFVEVDPNIYRFKYDGVTQSIAVNNGTPLTATPASGSHTFDDLFIGSGGATTLRGQIAELLVYDSGLSVANVGLVEAYLAARWGITIA